MVKDINYTDKDETFLMKEASSRFGNEVALRITYCEQIERTKVGKVRFVVSELNNMNKNTVITPPRKHNRFACAVINMRHAARPARERRAA